MSSLRFACLGTIAALFATVCGGCGSGGSHVRTRPSGDRVRLGEPIQYLPGGLRTLATRAIPGSGRLSVIAKRYRFQGHVYLDIAYDVEQPDGSGGGSGVRVEGRSPFTWSFGGECSDSSHRALIVVVGLLREPRGTVLAYVAGRPHRLWTAPVPAYLHAGGVVAYTVLGEPPERIVVRASADRTVMSQNLGHEGPISCKHGSGSIILFANKH